jgi:hypothetical protein
MGVVVQTAVLVALCAAGVEAGTLFVAKSGSDANPGTADKPFLTIQKAADAMQPGDVCLVGKGVYRETVRPSASGKPGKQIRFAAQPGQVVVITGAEAVTGWKPYQRGIYQAKIDWDCTQVFAKCQAMVQARWPNTGPDLLHPHLATARKGSNTTTIVDPALAQPAGTWDGALAHITPGARWVSWTVPVKSYDPEKHAITFDQFAEPGWPYGVDKDNTFYYLTGVLSALDVPNEWHFDAKTGTLYVYPPDGRAPVRIEAKKRQFAFDLSNRSYVEVSGFRVFASSANLADADHCTVENCHFKYVDHFLKGGGWGVGMDDSGVVVSGHHNEIRRCSIAWSAGNGVSLLGENNKVTNCVIHDVDYSASDCSAVRAMGRGHVVSRNTLYNGGRSLVVHRYLKTGRIEYNHIYSPGLLTTDLGATYCFHTDGEGTVIAYNWVHDNKAHCGIGIYVDNDSPNHIVRHNVSWGNENSGIRINTPCKNSQFYNNTCFSNGTSFDYWGKDNDMTGTRVVNNIGFKGEAKFCPQAVVENNCFDKDPKMVDAAKRDFTLQPDSPCIDVGIEIPGVTDGFKGKAPEIGAYEYGGEKWVPGHDWGDPPDVRY